MFPGEEVVKSVDGPVQMFRDITCTSVIGSKNCYMSAQNIYSTYAEKGHYGDYGRQEYAERTTQ